MKVLPATVSAARRAPAAVLAVQEYVRDAPAFPLAGLTVSQGALLVAVHATAGVIVRVRVPFPAAARAVAPVAESVTTGPA